MAESDALEEFVREAMAQGQGRDWIKAELATAGWPEHQVVIALSAYERTSNGIPVPSARVRNRPNAWFFAEIAEFSTQVFQLIEWIIVLVAVQYAAVRVASTSLKVLTVVLWFLFIGHLVAVWLRFEWWLFPNFDRSNMKTPRALLGAAFTLAAGYSLLMLATDVANRLIQLQVGN